MVVHFRHFSQSSKTKNMKQIFTSFLFILATSTLFAQVTWNFTTLTPSSGTPAANIATISGVSQGNNNGTTSILSSTSASNTYTGFSAGNNAAAASFTGALNTATSTYFQVTFTPSPGYSVNITNIQLGNRSTATGPQLLSIRSDVDAFATDAGTVAPANNSSWALLTPTVFTPIIGAPSAAVVVRIYASAGTGVPAVNTANWRIDDLVFTLIGILPVKLESFQATIKQNNVLLNWKVAQEYGITNYEIEKSSNGTDFSKIGAVAAQSQTNYNFTEFNAGLGNFYYRLKIKEQDGSFNYSPVVKAKLNGKGLNMNTIYPSPAKEELKISIANTAKENAVLTIVDFNGKLVYSNNLSLENGILEQKVNLSNLKSGMYIVKVSTATTTTMDKFIKQ
jgi:Secretion system C-terminal sorting domain